VKTRENIHNPKLLYLKTRENLHTIKTTNKYFFHKFSPPTPDLLCKTTKAGLGRAV